MPLLLLPPLPQAARDLVRSINVTADLIECSLAADEHQGPPTEGGNAAPQPELPGWDRLMGINSFSIERALQVGAAGAAGRACGGVGGRRRWVGAVGG